MKLEHEMVLNSHLIQWVKFYPYENPTEDLSIAACEIKFEGEDSLMTFFDIAAQRIYTYYETSEYRHFWPKKIAWS